MESFLQPCNCITLQSYRNKSNIQINKKSNLSLRFLQKTAILLHMRTIWNEH